MVRLLVLCIFLVILKTVVSAKDIESAPGIWSDWGGWSLCNATCNGGTKSRERVCNNSEPQHGRTECEGDAEEAQECNVKPCEPVCKKRLEIGIILDASSSVSNKNWNQTIEFVKTFSEEFDVNPTEAHFGILRFSWKAYLDFRISDRKYWHPETFKQKVSSLVHAYGGTRTDLALKLAEREFFCEACGLREGVPKLLLVLTDGKSSITSTPMTNVTVNLKRLDVNIIAIGVGPRIDREELKEIASIESNVFILDGYSNLKDRINEMINISCETKTKEKIPGNWSKWSSWTSCSATCNGGKRSRDRVCNNPEPQHGGAECEGEAEEAQKCNVEPCEPVCKKQLEVGIILDASTSVTQNNWDKTIEFVKKFSQEFDVSPAEVHFGVIRFAYKAHFDIKISDPTYWHPQAFESKVDTLKYVYGGTRTDLALKLAENELFCKSCGLREGVPKLLLVLTDGQSSFKSVPMTEATKNLKEMKVNIISIGVGPMIDKEELKEIATDESHVFILDGYEYLKDKINGILKVACRTSFNNSRR